jgi:hypothetical protein
MDTTGLARVVEEWLDAEEGRLVTLQTRIRTLQQRAPLGVLAEASITEMDGTLKGELERLLSSS